MPPSKECQGTFESLQRGQHGQFRTEHTSFYEAHPCLRQQAKDVNSKSAFSLCLGAIYLHRLTKMTACPEAKLINMSATFLSSVNCFTPNHTQQRTQCCGGCSSKKVKQKLGI